MALPYTPEALRPLRRVEYDKLVELGMLGKDDKIELIRGVLLRMSPIGPPHSATVTRLSRLLVLALRHRALVSVQGPLAASDDSEPQPDVMVVAEGDYDAAHPAEALLVIEVSDSSLSVDRGVKRALYAECAVPEYWIVNLKDRVVEVYTEPEGATYRTERHVLPGESLTPLSLPDVTVAVSDFLK